MAASAIAGRVGRPHRRRRRAPSRRAGPSTTSPPATRSGATRRPRHGVQGHLPGGGRSSSWPTSSGSRTTTRSSTRSRPSSRSRSSYLTDALTPLKPEIDGDVKVFKLTIDEIEQQIDELMPPVAGLGYNRPVAGPDDPRQPGRQGPGGLHQQPEGDDRRPLPRRRVRRLLPGRRPVRDPAADHARRDLHLRLLGQERRLADVPLAPQRDRPGRARAARGVHRRRRSREPARSTTASTSGSRTTSSAGSRSTATASRRPCRSSPRRARRSASGS